MYCYRFNRNIRIPHTNISEAGGVSVTWWVGTDAEKRIKQIPLWGINLYVHNFTDRR